MIGSIDVDDEKPGVTVVTVRGDVDTLQLLRKAVSKVAAGEPLAEVVLGDREGRELRLRLVHVF